MLRQPRLSRFSRTSDSIQWWGLHVLSRSFTYMTWRLLSYYISSPLHSAWSLKSPQPIPLDPTSQVSRTMSAHSPATNISRKSAKVPKVPSYPRGMEGWLMVHMTQSWSRKHAIAASIIASIGRELHILWQKPNWLWRHQDTGNHGSLRNVRKIREGKSCFNLEKTSQSRTTRMFECASR